MNFVYLYIIYIVLGCYASIFAPENTAIIAGQGMTMNCPINNGHIIRQWKLQRNSTSIREEGIYNNWKDNSRILNLRFGIDAKRNLYLNSTELDDAGIYTCIAQLHEHLEPLQQPFQYSAQLIVFEAAPVCSSTLVRDEDSDMKNSSLVVMTCFANFRGFWAPTVEWRLHEANRNDYVHGRVMTQSARVNVIPGTRTDSSLMTMINSTKHEHFYSCRFYFTAENYSQITNATNIPRFSYTWNSSAFGILQSNSNISIHDGHVTLFTCLVVLAICMPVASLAICVVVKKKLKPGSTEKAEETAIDSNPGDYQNVTTSPDSIIGDPHTAEYMELTSLAHASPSIYANIAGNMPAVPNNPLIDYETIFD